MIKPKASVLKMSPYHPPIEGRAKYMRLDFNENLMGPTKKLENFKIDREFFSIYPEYGDFKKKLAIYYAQKEETLLPTNGADEGIKIVVDTYVDKGDEVILIEPTFPMFCVYAEIAGAKIKRVSYEKDFSFPIEKVLKLISKKTRLIVFANPNNPTGTLVEKRDVERILKQAKNTIVLVDEAYGKFSKQTCRDLIKTHDNLIVATSFSKVFGLAGLRLGVLFSQKKNIEYLSSVRSPYSVNSLAVKIGMIALDDPTYVDRYVQEVIQERKRLAEFFTRKKIYCHEGFANFILIKPDHSDKLYEFLKEKGILIRKVALKGYVRITIGRKDQMDTLIRCLEKFYE